jgi:hypothetical protein
LLRGCCAIAVQSLCDRFTIASQSLRNHCTIFAIAALSLLSLHYVCNRFVIDSQLLRYRSPPAKLSLRYRCVITAPSLLYRCTIIFDRFEIAALSLRYRCVIAV